MAGLWLAMAPAVAAQQERPVGQAGGWDVIAEADGRTGHCAASRRFEGREVRIGADGERWTLALQADPPGEVGGFSIDGGDLPVDAARDGNRTSLALTRPAQEAVRNGSLARIELDGAAVEVPLNGTAAAMLRLQDCVTRGGEAPDEAALTAVPDLPEPGPIGPGCPEREAAASAWDGAEDSVTLTWTAEDAEGLLLFWVDPFGRLLPVPVAFDAGNGSVTLDAYEGQNFVAIDTVGACRGGLLRATGDAATYPVR